MSAPCEPVLTRGIAFPKSQEQLIQGVLGLPLTHEGLTNVYAPCLPDSQCFVTDFECQQDRFKYRVSWRDLEGRELAHAISRVARHPGGSLELHRSDVFVVPECRGQAVSVKILQQEMSLLRQASVHPDSRITLEAGWATVEGQIQRLGAYTWAHYGFDFADAYPQGKSHLCVYDCDCSPAYQELPDAQLMGKQFQAWVEHHYRDQPKVAAALEVAGKSVQHPWEMANLALPGHKIPVQVAGKSAECNIGKAFLLSEFCSNWSGVFRVNDPKFAGQPVAEGVFHQQVESADARMQGQRQQLEAQLEEQPEMALERLKVRADASWIERLEKLSLRRPDLQARVDEVIDRIRCVGFVKRLKGQQRKAWSESTQAVICEQRERFDRGWTGYVCKVGQGQGDRSWGGRLKSWASRCFGDGDA